jgi:hypothetical protein
MGKERNKLKGLYSQKRQLEDKKRVAEKNSKEAAANLQVINTKLILVNKEIKKYENKTIFITTHAIDRYRERVDQSKTIQEIKDEILTDKFYSMVNTLGDGQYPVLDYMVAVEDRKVTTIFKV